MTSSSSSPSSWPSSEGHCLREERSMHKFGHLHLHHPPPPPPPPCRCKKHRRHCHHSRFSPPPPPPPPFHGRHDFFALSDHSPPLCWPHHYRHKKHELRIKPPKPSKKIHKLHRKLMKAYMKLPKCHHHGSHYHHTHFPPPRGGIFGTRSGHHHPPGCCLHGTEKEGFSTEEDCRLQNMGISDSYRPHCQSLHHKIRPICPLIKSEIVRGEVATENTMIEESPVEPPIEDVAVPLVSNMPQAEELAPVIPAP